MKFIIGWVIGEASVSMCSLICGVRVQILRFVSIKVKVYALGIFVTRNSLQLFGCLNQPAFFDDILSQDAATFFPSALHVCARAVTGKQVAGALAEKFKLATSLEAFNKTLFDGIGFSGIKASAMTRVFPRPREASQLGLAH